MGLGPSEVMSKPSYTLVWIYDVELDLFTMSPRVGPTSDIRAPRRFLVRATEEVGVAFDIAHDGTKPLLDSDRISNPNDDRR